MDHIPSFYPMRQDIFQKHSYCKNIDHGGWCRHAILNKMSDFTLFVLWKKVWKDVHLYSWTWCLLSLYIYIVTDAQSLIVNLQCKHRRNLCNSLVQWCVYGWHCFHLCTAIMFRVHFTSKPFLCTTFACQCVRWFLDIFNVSFLYQIEFCVIMTHTKHD